MCYERAARMSFRSVPVPSSMLPLMNSVTLQRLEREGSLETISDAIRSGDSMYSVSELGIPELRYFFYKSRSTSRWPVQSLRSRARTCKSGEGIGCSHEYASVLIVA
jgi:hypothetical protein